MPCFTVWAAPILLSALAEVYLALLEDPETAARLTAALGIDATSVRIAPAVIQQLREPPPPLPASLRERGFRLQRTSTALRVSRPEREASLSARLEASRAAVEAEEAEQSFKNEVRAYQLSLRAAERERARAAMQLDWRPLFTIIGQSFLEELRGPLPDAGLTVPTPDGTGLTSTVVSPGLLGDTTIVINGSPTMLTVEVKGQVPEALDAAVSGALARAFGRLGVRPAALNIRRLDAPPPAAPRTTEEGDLEWAPEPPTQDTDLGLLRLYAENQLQQLQVYV